MVRKALPTDVDAINVLYYEYMALHQGFEPSIINYDANNSTFTGYLLTLLNKDSFSILVYEDGKTIKGFCLAKIVALPTLFKASAKLVIEDIAVDKDSRGSGIGELLVRETLAWAKNKEVTLAGVTVHAQNTLARNFWEKIGFGETNIQLYKAI